MDPVTGPQVRDLQKVDSQERKFMNTQSTWAKGKDGSMSWMARARAVATRGRRPFVYGALVAFSVLYYFRPEDFIPGLVYIPMARIAGAIGAVALAIGMMSGARAKVPHVVKILWLLLLQLALCVPFALWPGGAFSRVFDNFAKAVIVAMLIGMSVVTTWELRKLLWIQVSAIAMVTVASILLRNFRDGRLEGIQKNILENPNDLAISIAISFPIGLAFMLHARGFRRALWGTALVFMALGVVLTYSRSGLIALIFSLAICVWEYGIKGKRRYIVVVTALAFVIGLGAALSTAHYRARVESIFLGNIEGSGDKGSLEARKALLKKSLMVAATHPLFGVGPGCFVLVDEGWVVAHNSYTELAAEAGFPSLILFLWAVGASLKNIAQARKSTHYKEDPEFRLFTQALWAGLVAYLMGACFASTEYNLYPYFMMAYTCAMVRISNQALTDPVKGGEQQHLNRAIYDRIPQPQLISGR
jgi:O-antigen ligase/polysaccharide polymerase Wzy-like membrane protein